MTYCAYNIHKFTIFPFNIASTKSVSDFTIRGGVSKSMLSLPAFLSCVINIMMMKTKVGANHLTDHKAKLDQITG